MILDNGKKEESVYHWIERYTENGVFDVVTGYFTIGGLSFLIDQTDQKINEFRFVLGDMVCGDNNTDRTINLLNENVTVDAAIHLNVLAQKVVRFLEQEKVTIKTLEPNFCHAKTYIYNQEKNDHVKNYYITGSSNLTEAGFGLKVTNNVELNVVGQGTADEYKNMRRWFQELWTSKKAQLEKTMVDAQGKKFKISYKQYIIEEIKRLYKKYTPKELYYKVLYELFGHDLLMDQDNPDFTRQIGRLENSVIYNDLYDFQKKGALSLILMLQKYDGAILADAVGLGKTWTALAVMKFFQLQGREVILLCPKKLEQNWRRYKKNQESRFERDQFDYFVRFHTDLHIDRMQSYSDRADKLFINDKPKLIVIDESHNLRNDKSKRYQFIVDEILKKNEDVKVLMLSATPINNTLQDIRNQFRLMVQGDDAGFYDSLGIRNLEYTFRDAQKRFNEWRAEPTPKIADFIKILRPDFFKLTDSLTVARTRQMIEGQETDLVFPKKAKPENLFVTPKRIGNYETFEELIDQFPPMLSGYQPSFYVQPDIDISVLEDERQRDRFLVKMMYILLVKRLESSWYAFDMTVDKILYHHQNALNKIVEYQKNKQAQDLDYELQNELFEDEELDLDTFTLGKKRLISISDIDKAGTIENYKKDLKKDINQLNLLKSNLEIFKRKVDHETTLPNHLESHDDKLQKLIEKILEKRSNGHNHHNQKVLIFTTYTDTAKYLFNQLKARGFSKLAFVSGQESQSDDSEHSTKKFESILERFAPYTKLFVEKRWDHFKPQNPLANKMDLYVEWIDWVSTHDPETTEKLKNPIDILIATDVLSEGQNLQDCDMVINYDIHWNPVRVIQRMGRVDRIGSINDVVFGINFWPSNSIDRYLNLKDRVEQKMAAMKLAGSEVNIEFSDSFKEMAHDEDLEEKQTARMLKQMQVSWDDIEVSEQSLGFDDLSLERYRQELLRELRENEKKYKEMPKGVYTGFVKSDTETCPSNGLIALLGYPAKPEGIENYRYDGFDLIYIDQHGAEIVSNQKQVLDALMVHKDRPRFVRDEIEDGQPEAINKLKDSILQWLEDQKATVVEGEDGSKTKQMGQEALDVLDKLRYGDKDAVTRIKQNVKIEEKYEPDQFDLIAWFIVE